MESQIIELIFIGGITLLYIVFVIGINWWNYRDHKKYLDRIYPK